MSVAVRKRSVEILLFVEVGVCREAMGEFDRL